MTRILLALALFAAVAQARSMVVDDFAVDIAVSADGYLSVAETLQVSFSGSWNGIFRYVPYCYTYPNGLRAKLHLEVEAVTDGHGLPLTYWSSHEGDNLKLKIAVPGARDAKRTVVIRYRSRNAIRAYGAADGYDAHDEIYWNVTGNGWPFPIRHASATVKLPAGIPPEEVRTAAFTGRYGSVASNERVESLGEGRLRFETTAPLGPYEGLTIVVGFPSGHVSLPTTLQEAGWLLQANWGALLPILAALLWFLIWWARGRDSLSGATIIPEFEPPFDLRPSEVGVVADDRMDPHDVSACIVDLAARGYVDIDVQGDEPSFRLKRPAWREEGGLRDYEVRILETLFDEGEEVGTARRNRLGKAMEGIRSSIYRSLVEQDLFRGRPDQVRERWIAGTWGALAVVAVAGVMFATWWVTTILLVPCAIVMFLCAARMPQCTRRGLEALRRVRGMEDYLETAEKERLRDMPRDHFEKLLPYAIALGVHDRWTRLFAEMFAEPPTWFIAAPGTSLPLGFHSFVRSTTAATMYVPPRTQSSSGSGFAGSGWSGGSGFSSGGGFSGGGFGGGGGGGW